MSPQEGLQPSADEIQEEDQQVAGSVDVPQEGEWNIQQVPTVISEVIEAQGEAQRPIESQEECASTVPLQESGPAQGALATEVQEVLPLAVESNPREQDVPPAVHEEKTQSSDSEPPHDPKRFGALLNFWTQFSTPSHHDKWGKTQASHRAQQSPSSNIDLAAGNVPSQPIAESMHSTQSEENVDPLQHQTSAQPSDAILEEPETLEGATAALNLDFQAYLNVPKDDTPTSPIASPGAIGGEPFEQFTAFTQRPIGSSKDFQMVDEQ